MCLTVKEITFCGGHCKIFNGGLPIAIQTNGCAHFALGGPNPVCDGCLNGKMRLTTNLSFPEVWCEEHKRLAQENRGEANPMQGLRLIYRSVEEWMKIGKFRNARGYEVLRCSLLYQADLNSYVNNSIKTLKTRIADHEVQTESLRPRKRKLEEEADDESEHTVRYAKKIKPMRAPMVARKFSHQPFKTQLAPVPSVAARKLDYQPTKTELSPISSAKALKDEIPIGPELLDPMAPEVHGIPDSSLEAYNAIDWSNVLLDAPKDCTPAAPNPLDTNDDAYLRELFGLEDGELNVPEIFPS